MSISFFVAKEKLSDRHYPVKGSDNEIYYVRAVVPQDEAFRGEHPGHAAARYRERMMPGEIFLNAVPDKLDVKNHKAAFNWKRNSAGADPIETPV